MIYDSAAQVGNFAQNFVVVPQNTVFAEQENPHDMEWGKANSYPL